MVKDISVRIVGEHASVERYVSPDWTFEQLKARIETITGVPPASQSLTVVGPAGENKRALAAAPSATVSSLEITAGSQIDVKDTRPVDQQLDFDDDVEKYEMPLSEYEKRTDSVLEWKRKNQLGRFQEGSAQTAEAIDDEPCEWQVGQACWVKLASGSARGVVAYIGPVEGIPAGTWVGVRLDKAQGKNDGSVGGRRLFEAEANHGVFVRPSALISEDLDDLDEL